MDPLSTVRRRLVEQRLAGAALPTAGAVVGWLGAVQAQEFAEAKWSLSERMAGAPPDAEIERAFASGEIIRTHLLRPTWHFAAREDVRWLLRLSRPRVHALNHSMYRKTELDGDVLVRAHAVLARSLADGEPRTRRELADDLAAAGIACDGLRLAYVLMHAELEELVCSGPRRGKQHTYALLDERAPAGVAARSEADALDELALRYFRSHGPATVTDFAAWSSLTKTAARAALERIGGGLERVDDEAGTPWYAAREPVAPAPARLAGAFLIPTYDETTVAYKDLRVALGGPPQRPGQLDRAIVIDGLTVGSWCRRLERSAVVVEATLFRPLSGDEGPALAAAVDRFGRFLGVPGALELTAPR